MEPKFRPGHFLFSTFFLFITSCAYFNTLYNAQRYFDEAEKIRLEKEGKVVGEKSLLFYFFVDEILEARVVVEGVDSYDENEKIDFGEIGKNLEKELMVHFVMTQQSELSVSIIHQI